jgi:DNA-binding SARP family transcriptional activator/tetratricopeptide (TPR) repeat protein
VTCFRVLGPVEAWTDERRLVLGGPRQVTLLAFLLLNANRAVSADEVIDAVWGAKREGAAKRLQMGVSRLRRALAPLNGADGPRLRTVTGGYLLSVAPGELDAEVFAARVREGRRSLEADDPNDASGKLREALGLWRGPPLAEVAFEGFAQAEIRRLEELRVVALETRIEADLRQGRHEQLIGELEALLAEEPTRERLAGQLMLALYRSVRQADALEVYQRMRTHLAHELGLEPGPALQALQAQILEHAPALLGDTPPRQDAPLITQPTDRSRQPTGPLAGPIPLTPRLRPFGPAEFVGRHREKEQLAQALAGAAGGDRSVIVVTGEAGIGKTRLVSEMAAEYHAAGNLALGGRCDQRLGLPYQPFVEALEHLVVHAPVEFLRSHCEDHGSTVARLIPVLTRRLDLPPAELGGADETDRYVLFAAIDGLLAAAATTHVALLVLEDMHWADPTTLLLLSYIINSPRRARLTIVVTSRPPESEGEDPLVALLADLHRVPHAEHIHLDGLSATEVRTLTRDLVGRELVGSELELAARLHAGANGNPFFITELLRNRAETRAAPDLDANPPPLGVELPETVVSVLRLRLNRLDEACRDILELVAMTAGGAPVELLVRASSYDESVVVDKVEAAVRAGVLRERVELGATIVDFVHPLFHQAIQRRTSATRRAGLHLRIADAIDPKDDPGAERWVDELAHHVFAAGGPADPRRVARVCKRAGDVAMARTAFDAAAVQYERVLEAMSWTDSPYVADRAAVAASCAEAYHAAGNAADRRRMAEAAFADAAASNQPIVMGRAALAHGGARSTYGVASQRTMELLDQSLTRLGSGPNESGLRARVMSRLAQEHYHVGHYEVADRLGAQAVALARPGDNGSILAATMEGRVWTLQRPDTLAERLELVDEMVDGATRAGDRQQLIWGLIWRCSALLETGDIQGLETDMNRLDELTETLRIPSHMFRVMTLKSTWALMGGDYQRGAELAQETYRIGESIEPDNARQTLAAQLLPMLREQNALKGLAGEAARMAETYTAAPGWRCALAFVYLEADEPDESRRVFDELAREGFERIPRDLAWLLAHCYLAEVAAGLDETARAHELYRTLLPYGARNASVFEIASVGSVWHHLGLLARTAGTLEISADHFRAAIEFNDRTGQLPAAARSRYEYARLLATSDPPAAEKPLTEALAVARRLKLHRLVSQAERLAAGSSADVAAR